MPVTAPTRSSKRTTRRQPFLTAETTPDATLVGLAARGDERAFELLFERHRADVLAYATRMLRDHGRAEDVVQDVFVSAMRAIVGADRATQPVHVRAWLREIARRACIDQWRGATRRGEVSLDAPERLRAADAHRLADDDSLARTTDGREAVATLRLAFGDLPELQHAVLVQRELEGRSIAEIADRLKTTPTVVEGQLARGRRALGQAYKELESGQRCVAVRALCDVSIEGRLGVRDRHRVGHHVQGCDGCRRYARASGVDARLIDRGVLQRASLLLPLPLLRRLPLDHGLGGETAGGVLGAKILVGAAVVAAGGGGVYARSVVTPSSPREPVTPETSVVNDGIARFGMHSDAAGAPVLRLPGLGSGAGAVPLPRVGGASVRTTPVAPWRSGSALSVPSPQVTGGRAAGTVEPGGATEPSAVAPAQSGDSSAPTSLGTPPARSGTPGRSVPLAPASPTASVTSPSDDDAPSSPSDDAPGTGGSSTSTGDTPSDDAPMAVAAPLTVPAPAEDAAPAETPDVPADAPAPEPTVEEPAPAPVVDAPAPEPVAPAPAPDPASDAPAPASTDGTGSTPAASDEGAGVGH